MSDTRSFHVTSLRQRVACAQYDVDVDKVAEAILGRPTARMLILPWEAVDRGEVAAAERASDDVLEAA